MGQADAIIGMSCSQRRILIQDYGGTPQNVTVLWGPVDLDIFRLLEPPGDRVFRVGYAGNDSPWQGVEDALAPCELLSDHDDVGFRFIGISGAGYSGQGLPNAEFLETVSREQRAKLLAECDVLISPRKGRAAAVQYSFKVSCSLLWDARSSLRT